jgi:hypothetical protein
VAVVAVALNDDRNRMGRPLVASITSMTGACIVACL